MKKISEASQSPHDSARHNDLKAKLASIKAVELQPIVIAEVLIEPSEIEEIESFQLPPEFLDASDRIRSVARMTTVEIERLNRNETPNLITTDIITAATDQVGHQFLDALQSTDTINNHNAAMSVVEILDATIANRNLVQMVASPFRVVDLDTTLRLKEIKEQMEAEHQRVNEWLENDNLFSVSNSSIIEEKKPFQIVEFDFDSVDESVGMRTSSRWMKMRIAEKIEIVDEMNIQLESLSDDILGNIQEAIVNCEIADQELQKLDQEVEVTPLIQNNAETADALMLVAIDINLIISDNRPSLPEEVAEASNEAVMILRNSFKKTLNLSDALVTSDETKQIEEKKIEQFELIAQDISNSIDVMDNSIPSACARAEIMDISHATADKSLERKLMNRSKRILEQVNEALDLCRQEQSSLESSYHEDGSIQYFSILSDNNSAAIDNLEEVQNILFNDLSDPETDPEP